MKRPRKIPRLFHLWPPRTAACFAVKRVRSSQTLAAGSPIAVGALFCAGIVDSDGFLLRLLFLRGAISHRKNTNVLAPFWGFQGEKPS